jgi:AraC-like DNA-binding protein
LYKTGIDYFIENLYYIKMKIDENYPGIPRSVSSIFAYHLPGNGNSRLQINGLALKEIMKPCWNLRKSGNSDYLILYFYGPVLFQLRDGEYEEIQNKWIILSPGTTHNYGSHEGNWSHSWLHLSGSFPKELLHEQKIPVNCLIDMDDSHIFEDLLIRLHEEIYFNLNPEIQILSNELQSAFMRISRYIGQSSCQTIVPDPVCGIKQILDYNYRSSHSLKSLSELSGYSAPYLCEKFSQYYKYPPIEYLIRRRISISKLFLKNTDWRISEICAKTGYDDLYYFSRLFKNRVGMSPSQYRKSVKYNV